MTGSPKASTTVDAPNTLSAHRGFELREQAPQSTVSRTQEITLENVHPPDITAHPPTSLHVLVLLLLQKALISNI